MTVSCWQKVNLERKNLLLTLSSSGQFMKRRCREKRGDAEILDSLLLPFLMIITETVMVLHSSRCRSLMKWANDSHLNDRRDEMGNSISGNEMGVLLSWTLSIQRKREIQEENALPALWGRHSRRKSSRRGTAAAGGELTREQNERQVFNKSRRAVGCLTNSTLTKRIER